MKNTKNVAKKISYIDYECKIGEKVYWKNLKNDYFEGTIIKWLENDVALVKLNDNSLIEVQC